MSAQRCIVCRRPGTMELGAFLPNGDTAAFTSCDRHEGAVMRRLQRLLAAA